MEEKPFGGKFDFIRFNLAYPQKDIEIIRNCTENINSNLYAESIDTRRLNSFGGKFGFIRFDLSSIRKSIAIVRNCTEELKSDIHIGEINHFSRVSNGEVLSKSTLVNSVLTMRTVLDTLYAKHNLISLLPLVRGVSESFETSCNLVSMLMTTRIALESTYTKHNLASLLLTTRTVSELVYANHNLVSLSPAVRHTSEAFASNCNLKAVIPIERTVVEAASNRSFIKSYTLKSFGGRFGFIRFDLAVVEKDIPIVRTCSERVYSTIGIGMLSHTYRLMSEGVNSKAEAKISYLTSRNPSEILMQHSNVLVRIISDRGSLELIFGSYYTSKRINIERESVCDLLGVSSAGKRIHTKPIPATEKISGNIAVSKNLSFSRMITEALHCITETSLTEYYVASFNVSLPPGSELQINSSNFTVRIDGSNALDFQKGHWIMLNRNTIELIIDSGTGGYLKGEIIYTERYI